ncbi:hypothetical protein Tco_0143748 [Tanacetum coccineum]
MPDDSPLPGGHTTGSVEGGMTLHELTILCTKLSHKVENLETELKQTKQTYGVAFTKIIKKVKKLEQTVKTSQARRRTQIIASHDEEDSVAEDPSKQGRSMIEEIHLDAGILLAPPHEKFDRDDLVKLWDLVKERFSTTEPTDDKEKELWVELKRLFEPDNDDTLWKLQRYMHDP